VREKVGVGWWCSAGGGESADDEVGLAAAGALAKAVPLVLVWLAPVNYDDSILIDDAPRNRQHWSLEMALNDEFREPIHRVNHSGHAVWHEVVCLRGLARRTFSSQPSRNSRAASAWIAPRHAISRTWLNMAKQPALQAMLLRGFFRWPHGCVVLQVKCAMEMNVLLDPEPKTPHCDPNFL
jgi:hypothetical protein